MSGEVRLFRRCRTSGRDPVPWGDSSCYDGCGCREYIALPAAEFERRAAALRLLEARANYLLSYGDPFTQRVLRGELDQHILGADTTSPAG